MDFYVWVMLGTTMTPLLVLYEWWLRKYDMNTWLCRVLVPIVCVILPFIYILCFVMLLSAVIVSVIRGWLRGDRDMRGIASRGN